MISGKVIGKEIDENGNIRVKTEYTLTDGSKKVGSTRYNFKNFSQEMVLKDVQAHCKTLMVKTYALKKHLELIDTVDLSDTEVNLSEVQVMMTAPEYDSDGKVTKEATYITIGDK